MRSFVLGHVCVLTYPALGSVPRHLRLGPHTGARDAGGEQSTAQHTARNTFQQEGQEGLLVVLHDRGQRACEWEFTEVVKCQS